MNERQDVSATVIDGPIAHAAAPPDPRSGERPGDGRQSAHEERQRREAKALRANLLRRKQQQRSRRTVPAPAPDAPCDQVAPPQIIPASNKLRDSSGEG